MSKRLWSMQRAITAAACAVALWAGQFVLQFAGAADSASPYVGTWSGTWEGNGGGNGLIDFTLTMDGGGRLLGRIDVVQDEGTFSAEFLTPTISENKLTTMYEFKLNPEQEIIFIGTFHGSSATGTWSLRNKGGEQIVATGTWQSVKK